MCVGGVCVCVAVSVVVDFVPTDALFVRPSPKPPPPPLPCTDTHPVPIPKPLRAGAPLPYLKHARPWSYLAATKTSHIMYHGTAVRPLRRCLSAASAGAAHARALPSTTSQYTVLRLFSDAPTKQWISDRAETTPLIVTTDTHSFVGQLPFTNVAHGCMRSATTRPMNPEGSALDATPSFAAPSSD